MANPEILIVGAGPVGLTAALELTRRGLPVRIIDDGPGPHTTSRAVAINPRTLDLLTPSGLTPKLLNAGIRLRALNIHLSNGRDIRVEMRAVDYRYDFILALPQSDTERLMIETLSTPVEWNTKLVGLKSPKRPVITLVRDGATETVTPRIVIGADGARSPVRHALGIGFDGKSYPHEWSLADIEAESPYAPNELHMFDLAPYVVACIPLKAGITRVISNHSNVMERLPPRMTARATLWQSQFRIDHRIVETYQKGHIFLAGDAAHIHSPVGGRGMNLGIEDAAWLAYLIERGETDRYTEQRKPAARSVIRQTDFATRFLSSDSWIVRQMRQIVFPMVGASPQLQGRILRGLMGLTSTPPPWLKS